MSIGHVYVFFREVSIQVLCPFLNLVCLFFLVVFYKFFKILEFNPYHMYHWWICDMFSHSVGCLFILLMVSFAVQKSFSSMWSHLFFLSFISFARGHMSEKILLQEIPEVLLPMCSSRIFMVSSLKFVFNPFWVYSCVPCKKVVYFLFFILFLHISVQFSQHHLFNRLSLPQVMFSPPLSNINGL